MQNYGFFRYRVYKGIHGVQEYTGCTRVYMMYKVYGVDDSIQGYTRVYRVY